MLKEEKKSKKKFSGIQTGISSLILIFSVLCLVIFSVLSLSSSQNDYKLAEKNEETVKNYYEADAKGEELKAQLWRGIEGAYAEAAGAGAYDEEVKHFLEDLERSWTDGKLKYIPEERVIVGYIPAGNEQALAFEIEVSSYEMMNESKLTAGDAQPISIERWSIYNTEDYEVDDSMPVWDGNV